MSTEINEGLLSVINKISLFRFRCLAQELAVGCRQEVVVEAMGWYQVEEYIKGLEVGTPPLVEAKECNLLVEA